MRETKSNWKKLNRLGNRNQANGAENQKHKLILYVCAEETPLTNWTRKSIWLIENESTILSSQRWDLCPRRLNKCLSFDTLTLNFIHREQIGMWHRSSDTIQLYFSAIQIHICPLNSNWRPIKIFQHSNAKWRNFSNDINHKPNELNFKILPLARCGISDN